MKVVNVMFEDEDHELLTLAKGSENWRDFILTLVTSKKKQK